MNEPRLEVLRLAPRRALALQHIATHPGASNREIAAGAGIGDETQISRLLARMQELGLAVNRRATHDRGGPNAWHLTPDGRRLATAAKRANQPL